MTTPAMWAKAQKWFARMFGSIGTIPPAVNRQDRRTRLSIARKQAAKQSTVETLQE